MRRAFYFFLAIIFLNSSIQTLNASNNKESFELEKKNFSSSPHINHEGLAEELRYRFKDQELLRAALYPLLKQDKSPSKVKSAKRKFDHLEFYGDRVLNLFIAERLIKLLPDQDRGDLALVYQSLTGNEPLAEVYLRHLSIEKYLPFPERPSCKYCNLVEALIGAIALDDPKNGSKNAKKFMMFILDDHLLQEQIKKILALKGIPLTQLCLPQVKEVLALVCSSKRMLKENPKSLLHEVLSVAWMDYPTYTCTIGKNASELPILYAYVSGAQIGREFTDLRGEGYSKQEAEENAAINALNFLAKRELWPRLPSDVFFLKYRTLLKEFIDLKRSEGCDFLSKTPPCEQFTLQLILNEQVIGEGSHIFKEEAKEQAAKQAYTYFSKEVPVIAPERPTPKNYKQSIKELNDKRKIYKIILDDPKPAENGFTCEAKIGDKVIGEGRGPSKNIAKENAAKEAYNQFLDDIQIKTPVKNFRNLLEEIAVTLDGKIRHLWTYKYVFILNDRPRPLLITDLGSTATEAKENASLKACYELIRIEEEKNQRQNNHLSSILLPATPGLTASKASARSSKKGSQAASRPKKSSAAAPKKRTKKQPSHKPLTGAKTLPVPSKPSKTLERGRVKNTPGKNEEK